MRIAAISTGPATHLDHLGVLSSLLNVPLIITDSSHETILNAFYPKCSYALIEDLSLKHLADHYDMLLGCGKFWALELQSSLELFYGKKMRFVFCPHGNSDKGSAQKNHVAQDISLVYGDHMIDLLNATGAATHIKKTIRTGNYRHFFYLENKAFYDELAFKHVFSNFDPHLKTILYAPTWQDEDRGSSFFTSLDAVISKLAFKYNTIIKLHPLLSEHEPAKTHYLISKYDDQKNVLFLLDFPAIYPLLNKIDIYLGDYSSIGYDFLIFNKPMYFILPQGGAGPLSSCGVVINDVENCLYEIESSLMHNQDSLYESRRALYDYAFGDAVSIETLKLNLFQS